MNGGKESSTDKLVNVPAHRMAYMWMERLINVISEWIFSQEPIRENKIVPYILRTMHVTVRVETKKLPHSSGITPWRLEFRISCHYHRKETDRQTEREREERKSCCQNYLLTFCHGCQGVRWASRQTCQKLLSNMKRSWLVVCIHLSLSLYILFDRVGTTARLILLGWLNQGG